MSVKRVLISLPDEILDKIDKRVEEECKHLNNKTNRSKLIRDAFEYYIKTFLIPSL